MAPKSSAFLLTILSVLLVLAPNEASARGAIFGRWRPIGDPNKDPEVVEIAKFAVTEHNSKAHTNLSLVSVVNGETQVVAGTKYRLVVAAGYGPGASDPKNYKAVVWSKPWQGFKQLICFEEFQGY
ncbi:hypothetical protein OROGR_003313 [Orobanche gracilis]